MRPAVIMGAWNRRPPARPNTIALNVTTASVHRGQVVVKMTRLEFRFLSVLLAAPGPVSRGEVVEILYGDRADGGPEWAHHTPYVVVFRVREAMSPIGVEIVSRGYGFGWQAIIDDTAPAEARAA